MRAIAALLVVCQHAAWKAHQYSTDPWQGFRVGEAGVDLFFIISGFIMCEATSRRATHFRDFMKARALRILPLYWLLTSVALLACVIAPRFVNSGEATAILPSYLLVPSESRYLIQNGWTLSYEFLFYTIFGLGLASRSAARYAVPALVLVALGTIGLFWTSGPLLGRFITHPLLLEFAMGIASYHLLRRLTPGGAFACILIALGIAGLLVVNHIGTIVHRALSYGLPCCALFMGIASAEPVLVRWAGHPVARALQTIGDSSYSLYLAHIFVLGGTSLVLARTPLMRFGHGYAVALVVASVAGGVLCYRLLEQPLSRAIKGRLAPHAAS